MQVRVGSGPKETEDKIELSSRVMTLADTDDATTAGTDKTASKREPQARIGTVRSVKKGQIQVLVRLECVRVRVYVYWLDSNTHTHCWNYW